MRAAIFIIIAFIATAGSCSKDLDPSGPACNVADAVNDLPWLKAKAQELEASDLHQYHYINKGIYNGQTVFVMANCCPFCSWIPIAYTCDGEQVTDFDFQKVENSEVFWKSKDNVCQFTQK